MYHSRSPLSTSVWRHRGWGLQILMALCLSASLIAQDVNRLGRMFIVDSGEKLFKNSQIVLVDADEARILSTFPTGDNADIALSPDGKRLYVAEVLRSPSFGQWLSTYDVSTGQLLNRIRNEDMIQHTMTSYSSAMAMSPSGRWIYMVKYRSSDDGSYYFYLTAFDTATNQFLPRFVRLPYGTSNMLPTHNDLHVVFTYMGSNLVYNVSLEAGATAIRSVAIQKPSVEQEAQSDSPLSIAPPEPKASWSAAFMRPSDDKVFMVRGSDRSVFSVDTTTETSEKTGVITTLGNSQLRGAIVSKSGRGLFLRNLVDLYSQGGNKGFLHSNQIISVDPDTFTQINVLKTREPFDAMFLSNDEKTLFTISSDQATIGVVDAVSLKEVKQISGVGKHPIFAVALP